ncbi:hypothetical protein Krad_2399 [Kineococcus radiotolerans SRS30216 = ATCC BAA-149]|uniref:Uncharacterized protein n=1 Tax=Kineococcus radiotolerans (strain ATCC BAA-149 / DSM 14245 / SRS30216) TaxID=266940 RepID=A6WAP0_KINRD|nr:hypothetical protein Krad_2399 [Kineococcus radiotolerans SRS30216 = ATCC BAA-149]
MDGLLPRVNAGGGHGLTAGGHLGCVLRFPLNVYALVLPVRSTARSSSGPCDVCG